MEAVTQLKKKKTDLFIRTPAPPVPFSCHEIAVTWLSSFEIMWLTGRTEA